MASAPKLSREELARLSASPPEQSPEARRAWRLFWILVALSLLLHVALLVLSAWLGARRAPVVQAQSEPVPVQFVEAPPTPSPQPPSEETPFRSSTSSRAESPVPTPPPEPAPRTLPRSLGVSPVPEIPHAAPPRAERSPPRPQEEEVQPRQEEEAPEEGIGLKQETSDEKRRRLVQGLQGLGGVGQSWESAAESAPDIPGGAFGGSSMMFESKADVDWGPYADQLKRIVRSNWRIANTAEWLQGIVQVHFFIRRDGTIEDLQYVSKTGTDPLDIPAYDAIRLSGPLPKPPLPADDPEDRVGVTWGFLYNIDEARYHQWERQQRFQQRRAEGR